MVVVLRVFEYKAWCLLRDTECLRDCKYNQHQIKYPVSQNKMVQFGVPDESPEQSPANRPQKERSTGINADDRRTSAGQNARTSSYKSPNAQGTRARAPTPQIWRMGNIHRERQGSFYRSRPSPIKVPKERWTWYGNRGPNGKWLSSPAQRAHLETEPESASGKLPSRPRYQPLGTQKIGRAHV